MSGWYKENPDVNVEEDDLRNSDEGHFAKANDCKIIRHDSDAVEAYWYMLATCKQVLYTRD